MVISYLLTNGLYYEACVLNDIWIHISKFFMLISPKLGQPEHGSITFL